jgi:membrane protease YdiL (CAAX protease family)
VKFLSKLEKQPWSGDDSSPAGVAGAFFLLASAIFIVPFIAQKLPGEGLTLPDILLFSAMPGVCAYGFFVAKKIPLRLLTVKEVFQCIGWGILIILISGVVTFLWQILLSIFNVPFEKEQFAMTLIRACQAGELIKLFFAFCVFTPLIEELLFRRIIYGFFLKWGYGFAFLFTGVTMGFWIFNHSPASIFMGDSGSHFIGYFAAVISSSVTYFHFDGSLTRFPILVPFFVLALPLFDTFMVVLIRTLNKKPFWIGDHNHISHRFVRMGLSRKTAVRLVHLAALDIALCAFPVYWGDFKTAAILLLQAFLLLVIITILQFSLEARKDAVEKVEK